MKIRMLVLPGLLLLAGGLALAISGLGSDEIRVAGGEPSRQSSRRAAAGSESAWSAVHAAPEDATREAVESASDRVSVTLVGRVVNSAAGPIANAEVALFHRSQAAAGVGRRSGRAGFGRERGRRTGRRGRGGFGRRGGESMGSGETLVRKQIQRRLEQFKVRKLPGAVRTDAEGRFELRGEFSSRNSFEIRVDHAVYVPKTVRRRVVAARRGAADRVEDIVLQRGAQITGVVVDEYDRPVARAKVTLRESRKRGRGRAGLDFSALLDRRGSKPSAISDDKGRFAFHRVAAGSFVASAVADQHLPGTSKKFALVEGGDFAGARVELGIGARVTGTVIDSAGQPISDAKVEASWQRAVSQVQVAKPGGSPREGSGSRRGERGGRDRGSKESTKTDTHGVFVLDSLPHARFRLTVDHARYIKQVREGVEAASEPQMEFRLAGSLVLSGVVVDASTGEPVVHYGIRARELRDRDRGQSRRRSQRTALRERVDAYAKQRLGPTGAAPQRTPAAIEHLGGRFSLGRLEPGLYAIDVAGPGYVKTAAAVVRMALDKPPGELTLRLMRGGKISGQVIDRRTGKPVPRAQVELFLPALNLAPASKAVGSGRRERGRRPGRSANSELGERRLDRTRCDKQGRFVLDPQLPGDYQLRARMDGYPDQPLVDFLVHAARDSEVTVALLAGARVFGKVLNAAKGQRVTVVFTHRDGAKATARVDRENLSYEVKGLKPGDYFARVSTGRSGRSRRGGRFGDAGATDIARLREGPDLILREGDELRYDAGLEGQHLGSVNGMIRLNLEPARGLRVQLVRKLAAPAEVAAQGSSWRGRGGRRGGGSRSLQATVNRQGRFEIKDLPAGDYTLSVSRSSRGDMGSRLHQEAIVVASGQATQWQINLSTGRLLLALQDAETGEPASRASVALVLSGEAAGKISAQWRQLPSYTSLRSRAGKVDSSDIKPGTYLYSISGRGLTETKGQVTVAIGEDAVATIIKLRKGDGASSTSRQAQMFERLDKDGDGKLSKAELGRLGDRVKDIDADGDGVISIGEMRAWSTKRQASRAVDRARGGRRRGRR